MPIFLHISEKTYFCTLMRAEEENTVKQLPDVMPSRLLNTKLACEYCHGKGSGACIQKDDMQELYPLMAEADVLVLAAPIYYFTLSAQIQAPIQRMYCVNAPAKVKKMALLMSSYSPGVYDGVLAEFRDICNYWQAENMGHVTAKIDEQKTEATKQKIVELVKKL